MFKVIKVENFKEHVQHLVLLIFPFFERICFFLSLKSFLKCESKQNIIPKVRGLHTTEPLIQMNRHSLVFRKCCKSNTKYIISAIFGSIKYILWHRAQLKIYYMYFQGWQLDHCRYSYFWEVWFSVGWGMKEMENVFLTHGWKSGHRTLFPVSNKSIFG